MEYQANIFATREELELAIINDLGKTTERKDASIVGTVNELISLQLSHGQSVWGVPVVANDFVTEPIVEKPQRGPLFKSSLNYETN